ncbi:MarR family transcriptional regulator [Rhizobium sullae]|uniref:MarR family transcriptional regulator n=1 Tax=Rhizobium sullae TaxID=50338 RepID=A0A2N0D1H4_RHISU|nr:MarR family transcriptional regulator [Rhizobium sullae]PKA39902.1 MarR family transcriptional regulator [Rhizobium sullae]
MPPVNAPSRTEISDISVQRQILDERLFEGLAGVRLAMRRFLSFSEAALSAAQVTSQQYQALLVIKVASAGMITVRALAEQMLLQHNGAVQLVDRLATAGLAQRVPSLEDKRRVLVTLTSEGKVLVEALAKVHLEGMLANEPLLAESLAMLRGLALIG